MGLSIRVEGMPVTVTCPRCKCNFALPEGVQSASAQCPRCKLVSTFTAAPAAYGRADADTVDLGNSGYTCQVCGNAFDASQVYEQQGSYICHGCYARGATPAPSAGASRSRGSSAARRPARSAGSSFAVWAVWGIAIAATAAGLFFVKRRMSAEPSVATSQPAPLVASQPAPLLEVVPQTTPAPSAARSSWEKQNARYIHQLLLAAQQLTSNTPAAARKNYQKIFALVEGHEAQIKDPQLQQDLSAAKEAYAALEAAPEPSPTTVASAASEQPSTTTPPVERPATQTAAATQRAAIDQRQLTTLLSEARALAGKGDRFAALEAYRAAFDVVSDRQAELPADLQKQMVDAIAARTRLRGELKDSPELPARTAAGLLRQGMEALADSKWQAGLESLADARQILEKRLKTLDERATDEAYVNVLQGIAIGYVQTRQIQKAAALFDDKAPLGTLIEKRPTRDLVWNRAAIDMVQKFRIERSLKSLKQQLAAGKKVDEDLLNLFGTVLDFAREKSDYDRKKPEQRPRLLVESDKLYEEKNAELEATRRPMRRWGTQWLGESEMEEKLRLQREAQSVYDYAREAVSNAERDLGTARRGHLRRKGNMSYYEVNEAEVKEAEASLRSAKNTAEKARGAIPRPVWLAKVEPQVPRAQLEAIASATPPVSAPPAPGPMFTPPSDPGAAGVGSEPTPAPPIAAVPPAAVHVVRSAAAFPVDRLRLITAAAPLAEAQSVRVEDTQGGQFKARVIAKAGALALLEVEAKDVNGAMPFLNLADSAHAGPVRCAGFPEPSLFLPSVEVFDGTIGTPPAQGEWQVSLSRHPRLAGAPLLDAGNAVVGVVIAQRDDLAQKLPAVSVTELRSFLEGANAMPAQACANPDPSLIFHVIIEQ